MTGTLHRPLLKRRRRSPSDDPVPTFAIVFVNKAIEKSILNMTIWEKLRPCSQKLFQLVTNSNNANNILKKRSLSKPSCKLTSVFTILASYAFIWPMKKTKPITNENINLDKSQAVIQNADNLFENGHYENSYEILAECYAHDNVEIQWRIVRALYNMSKESKYDSNRRKEFVNQAYEIMKRLVTCHSDHNVVHKWYALILDAKSSQEGIKERIQQLENVKKHMDLAVTLNPEDATSLHMLGEWCYQITEMPWHQRKIAEVLFASPPHSTYEDALEYFLKAEAAEPRFYSMNLLRIGNCYMKMEKVDQAKYYLKLAASYPAKSNDDHQANKEATELLKKIK